MSENNTLENFYNEEGGYTLQVKHEDNEFIIGCIFPPQDEVFDYDPENYANQVCKAVNTFEEREALIKEMAEALEASQITLELAINGTPTGELRNRLTGANIAVLTVLTKYKSIIG